VQIADAVGFDFGVPIKFAGVIDFGACKRECILCPRGQLVGMIFEHGELAIPATILFSIILHDSFSDLK
jgi:hypothetical protein